MHHRRPALRLRGLIALVALFGLLPHPAAGAIRDGIHPLLRQEQGPLRHLRLADLQEPAFRGVLLPGVRAAPLAPHLVPGERLSEAVLGPEARDAGADSGHPVQDPLGVRGDEPLPDLPPRRCPRLRRADPRPAPAADRRAAGPPERPHPARADPRVRLQHDPARALPEGHSPLDRRGARRVLPRACGTPST